MSNPSKGQGEPPTPNTSGDEPKTFAQAAKSKHAEKSAPAETTLSRRQAVREDGPLYKVLSLSHIDNRMCGPGTKFPEVIYFGLPGTALKPLNKAAKDRKDQVRAIREDASLDDVGKHAKLTELSNLWNGVEVRDDYDDVPDAESDD